MNKKYFEEFTLRTCDCDMNGAWRPSAILETMQETAGAHSAVLGTGREVTGPLGIAWVLSRSRVEMARLPQIGARICVETYPLPLRHLFFPRVHVFRDAEGAEIGRASSLWVLMDVSARRIVSAPEIQERMPDNGDLPAPVAMPATVRPLPGEPEVRPLTPAYSDFDVNGHVNNTKYLDWCCNALGIEALRQGRLLRFDVNYETEILPGAELTTELTRQEARFSFCGLADGKRCFIVGGELSPRE